MRQTFCRSIVWLASLGALAVLLSACQGEKGGQPQPAQETVRLHGALPAGGPVKTAEESSDNPVPARPETLHPVGTAVKFDLEGRQLSEPITLGLAFDANSLPKGIPRDAVFLSYYDEASGEWVPEGGEVDPESDMVEVQTEHLSWWQPPPGTGMPGLRF